MPTQIIVLREKLGNYYYDASTPELWAESALEILTERWNSVYYYPEPSEMYSGASSLADILGDSWPGWEADRDAIQSAIEGYQGSLKEKYGDDKDYHTDKLRKLKYAVRRWAEEKSYRNWYESAQKAVEEQDTGMWQGRYHNEPRAWRLLMERSGAEYEGIALETVIQPKSPSR